MRMVIGGSQFCGQDRVGEVWSPFRLGDVDAALRVQMQWWTGSLLMVGHTVAWSEAAPLCDCLCSTGEHQALRARPTPGSWDWFFFLGNSVSR